MARCQRMLRRRGNADALGNIRMQRAMTQYCTKTVLNQRLPHREVPCMALWGVFEGKGMSTYRGIPKSLQRRGYAAKEVDLVLNRPEPWIGGGVKRSAPQLPSLTAASAGFLGAAPLDQGQGPLKAKKLRPRPFQSLCSRCTTIVIMVNITKVICGKP